MGTPMGIFFKPLLDEFGWTRDQLSLASSVTLLVFAILSPFLGRVIDRFGPKRMMLASVFSQIIASVVSGFAKNLGMIYLGRMLLEFKPIHANQVMINNWFVKKRGRALGFYSTGIPLGQLALAPLSQILIISWGWRETYYFWAVVVAVIMLPLLFFMKDRPKDKGQQTDGEFESTVSTSAATGAVSPNFDLGEALRYKGFWFLVVTQIICGITCGLMATHIVIMSTDLGYSAVTGATFLSVQGGVSLLGVLATGVISDRLARNKVLSLTHLIRASGLFLIIVPLLAGLNSLPVLYLGMAFFGFGWYTTSPLVAGLTADLFGHLRMGTILGIILATHMIGMAIGSYAGGLSFQINGNYNLVFSIAAGLELVACLAAFAIRPARTASR
jgi:MFS family permease